MKFFKFTNVFFDHNPALFCSLFFLLGISLFIFHKFLVLIFFIFAIGKKRFVIASCIFLIGFLYILFFYSDIKTITDPIEGKGYFKISSIKENNSFNRYYTYLGTLKSFETEKQTYHNLKCRIYVKKNRPIGNKNYFVKGTLIPNNYSFKLKNATFIEDDNSSNFSEKRFLLKKIFHRFLKKNIPDKKSANLLNALITGDVNNKFLSFSFSQIGLQHVLAISGFHFGILVIFFSFFIQLFIPKKYSIYILFIIVNIYFLFIGPLISVQRAYIMIQLGLIAQMINRKYNGLNALGIASIVILLIDPINLTNIGFQLSFLCSFSILLIYPLIDKFLSIWLIKRSKDQVDQLNIISRIGYKISSYIRQSLSLSIAVNLLILPVILYHFHKFSYISILYNLFIPLLIFFSIFLFFIGSLCILIPYVGIMINSLNSIYTSFVLKLITYPPVNMLFYLRIKMISYEFVLIYLMLITCVFLILKNHFGKKDIPEIFNLL